MAFNQNSSSSPKNMKIVQKIKKIKIKSRGDQSALSIQNNDNEINDNVNENFD